MTSITKQILAFNPVKMDFSTAKKEEKRLREEIQGQDKILKL